MKGECFPQKDTWSSLANAAEWSGRGSLGTTTSVNKVGGGSGSLDRSSFREMEGQSQTEMSLRDNRRKEIKPFINSQLPQEILL